MEEVIQTVSGLYRKKEECRYIDKEYYLVGDINIENSGDIYLINDRYIRMSTGKLVFNHTTKQYQLKNMTMIEGIVGFNDSEPIMGYFEVDNINNVKVVLKDKRTFNCINENIINLNFRERRSTGVFYHISILASKEFIKINKVDRAYKESLQYDSKNILENYIDIYNNHYKPIINKDLEEYSKVLQELTFGLEFETVKGSIPKTKINYLPLIPLRDGSINGLEYVTIPLEGSKGLHAIKDSVKELKKRTEYDDSCSLHLHIGNIPRTPEFILAFYKLISYYQDDLFKLFPLYKEYNFGVKRKNYSQPFPINKINFNMDPSIDIKNKTSLTKNFKVLFDFLSMNVRYEDYDCNLKNVNSHPADPNGTQKWNIKTRYYAYNLIPLIFGNKATIEFRIHTPTYDLNKIINFLFINSILINFVKENTAEILGNNYILTNNNLESIISRQVGSIKNFSKNHKSNIIYELQDYINLRRDFTYRNNCKGNIKGDEDELIFRSQINYETLGDINEILNKRTNQNIKLDGQIGILENGINIGIQEKIKRGVVIGSKKVNSPPKSIMDLKKKYLESIAGSSPLAYNWNIVGSRPEQGLKFGSSNIHFIDPPMNENFSIDHPKLEKNILEKLDELIDEKLGIPIDNNL